MVTKQTLIQYIDMKQESKEVRETIERLIVEIAKLQKRIDDIESGEKVKDKVYGGEGGWQGFTIEGVPTAEYKEKKNLLFTKKIKLEERKSTLEQLETDLICKVSEAEKFVSSIDDSHIRRIIRFRVFDNLSWNEVANKIGGGNSEDSVRMMFNRFLKEK